MSTSSWMTNRWYVAAWDSEVDSAPLARTICGVTMMFYRTLDRRVIAMRDACPHRLLPLSMGIREADSIRCRYHGLKLGPDGIAQEMPLKTEKLNRSICVETYAIAEKHRFVWVWIGDKEKADPASIPDLWPCSTPGWTFDGGHDRVGCDYRLLIDNLMDLTHETHVHSGSIGQPELMEAPIDTTSDGEAVTVTRWMPGIDAPPFWRGALKQDGPVDRWQVCHFVAPSSVIIDVGVAPVGNGATVDAHESVTCGGVRGFVIDSMTPETETSCHYFWGMARDFDADDAGFTARFKRQQGGVFAEDIEILEAQQKSIAANPDMKLRAYAIDSGGVRARRVIDRAIAANLAEEPLA